MELIPGAPWRPLTYPGNPSRSSLFTPDNLLIRTKNLRVMVVPRLDCEIDKAVPRRDRIEPLNSV